MSTAARIAAVFVLVVAATQWVNLAGSRDVLETTVHEREIDKIKTLSRLLQTEIPDQGVQSQLLARLLKAQGRLATSLQSKDPARIGDVAQILAEAHRVSHVDVLTITDADGIVVYRAHDPDRRGDVASEWGVVEALTGRSMLVSSGNSTGITIEAIEPLTIGERVVGAAIVGNRLDGEVLRVLSADLGAELALVSRAGKVVATSSPKIDAIDPKSVEEAFRTKVPVYRSNVAARTTLVYLPLHIIDEAWVGVAQVDSSSAYKLLDSASRDAAVRAGAIGLASIVAVILILHYALMPLRRLRERATRTLRQIAGERHAATGGDEITSVVKVLDTLTDRLIKRNEELAEAKHRADAASEAKSQFLANMSHEIRTPLNGVLGMAELLEGTRLDEVQARYCRALASSGRMLHDLLCDILDLAKIEARGVKLERVEFDVVELVTDVATTFRELAAKRATAFSLELDASVPNMVAGDPTRLRQVLSNLLGNAIKFTPSGRITFGVERLDRTASDRRTWLRFTVTDTGIGIAPEKLATLFRPFVQADSSTTRTHGGSGLGLAISKHLVELGGGSIHVRSEVGRGTTFWCDVRFATASPAATPQRPVAETTTFSGRVLVAEDNPVNREVIGPLLERLGVSVTVAEDGKQTVEAFEASTFDLVFMDCQMPVMDGYAAARKIRALEQDRRSGHVPIIALTACASESDRDACLAAGMDDYLSKPCSLQDLRAAIGRWLHARESSAAATPSPLRPNPEPTAQADSVPVLNPHPLRNLASIVPQGAEALVRKIVAAYVEDAPKRLAAMREAVNARSPDTLGKAAHALKSASANVGAERLAALAKEIEKLGRSGGLAGASELVDDAHGQFADVERELLRLFGSEVQDVVG